MNPLNAGFILLVLRVLLNALNQNSFYSNTIKFNTIKSLLLQLGILVTIYTLQAECQVSDTKTESRSSLLFLSRS